MNLCVTILTNEDALIKLCLDLLPGPGMSFGSNAEILAAKMVKHKGIHAGVIATQGTLPSLIGNRLLFNLLAASGDIVLVLATLATELALSPRKSIVT